MPLFILESIGDLNGYPNVLRYKFKGGSFGNGKRTFFIGFGR